MRSIGRQGITPQQLTYYRDEWKMSPAILSNGLLFLTGMTGTQRDGAVATDAEEQIRDAFAKVHDVLTEAGLAPDDIVEMTSYHVGISDHLEVFRRIRAEQLAEPYPAWTATEVSGFITPKVIVELRVVADASSMVPPET